MVYEPAVYWEERLSTHFNSVGVGNIGMSIPYNDMMYRVRRYRLSQVLKKHHIYVDNCRILDIGCGTGYFVDCYRQWGCQDIVGIDITDISVTRLSEKYPQYRFYRQDITQPLDTGCLGQFDLINCFDVMIHIVDPDLFHKALENISKLLKPGGLFICSDAHYPDKDRIMDTHVVFHAYTTYIRGFSPYSVDAVGLYPLFRWGFSHRPFLVKLFRRFPHLAEFLDKYALTLPLCYVRLGVFQKNSDQSAL